MPTVQEVEDLLRTALEAQDVDVTDISGEYVSSVTVPARQSPGSETKSVYDHINNLLR